MWFYENHMVLNPEKCYFLIINKDIANESVELSKNTVHDEAEKKTIDNDLTFKVIQSRL